jgi:hypothetical protein
MRVIELIPLVMAFLTSATSLAAALVQLQTAKIAAQATKKRPNRRRGHQKAPQPPPRAPKSAPTAAGSARSASKRLTPLGWLMGPEGGFSSLYGASRRLPGAPTACGA